MTYSTTVICVIFVHKYFHVRKFRVTVFLSFEMCSIYALCKFCSTYNYIHVRKFHCFRVTKNFYPTKISQIMVIATYVCISRPSSVTVSILYSFNISDSYPSLPVDCPRTTDRLLQY